MAANTIIQSVEIKLGAEYTENTAIGLYTVAGASYLRWSEVTLAGVAESWATGILLKNGIGDIVASSDISRGGNIANYDGMTVTAANAESLMQSLKDLQINLTGLSVTVTEFIGTIADSDATSRTIVFTGIVENIKWGDTALTLDLKNSLYKRETNLSTTNADGVTTPVTFGKHYPPAPDTVINNLAKFVRTVDTYDETIYTNEYFTGSNPEIKIFPVYEYTSSIQFAIKANGTTLALDIVPVDTYMIVAGGTGVEQIKQVTRLQKTGATTITVTLKDSLVTDLLDTGENRAWVQFVKIGRNHNVDIQPCKDFLKSADGLATATPELFTYADDKFNRIADYGFTIKDSNKNSLDIDGQQYSTNIDNIDSFVILPVTSLTLETTPTIQPLFSGSGNSYDKVVDGIYKTTLNPNMTVSSNSLSDASKAYDKLKTGYAAYVAQISGYTGAIVPGKVTWCHAFNFNLPKLPKNCEIDSISIGIKCFIPYLYPVDDTDNVFIARLNRFAYGISADNTSTFVIANEGADNTGSNIDDMPDFYWEDVSPPATTYNLNFNRDSVAIGGTFLSVNGYNLLKFTGMTREIYNTMSNGSFFIQRYVDDITITPFAANLDIYEIAIIVKLASSDIKKEIYSPLAGRIYGNTWGARKDADALIENPKDAIEHCARLQNWSEIPGHVVTDWGHSYSFDALIKISGTGSFDSTNLNYLTSQSAAICTEITDAAKQTTTAIKKKICDTFGLCSYIDESGNECIETLELTNPTGDANTITLADAIGGIGDIEEPRIENIFCEPLVNYLYNQGSGNFDKTLKVTNIDATEWQSAYTPGYLDVDGEIVWNSCKVLYNQFRWIEPCPSEFSDQNMIADYTTAVNYVKRKIAWMTKMRLPTITIDYDKGKDYTIYKHILVQMRMHTNNVLAECIIEKIVKSKNSATVKIDCIILSAIENAWYDTSDSTNIVNNTADLADGAVIDQ
jgi:hypothetical protein